MLSAFIPLILGTRPLLTDDPWPVEDGLFEVEFGQGLSGQREGYIYWKYGFGNRFEIDLGFPWIIEEPREQGEFEVSTKWPFFTSPLGSPLPDLALVAGWVPARGDYCLCGILGKELGPTELLANLFYEHDNPRVLAGAACVYYPVERLGVAGEVFYEADPVLGGGARFLPWDFLLLDLEYHRAMDDGRTQTLGLGFTVDF